MSTGLPANIIEKPSYLAELPKDDLKDMQKFLSPPRFKIIQGQTGPKFKPQFKDGDVLIVPQMTKVGDIETEFTFVPIHFFPTWACTNPWQLKDQLPFIREMSFEEDSVVAKKARAFVTEPCSENPKFFIKYSQVLNFLVRIVNTDIEMPQHPITMILNRGSFQYGRVLIELIEARKTPRYVCQFNAIAKFRIAKDGNYFSFDFRNAPEPWVPEAKVAAFREEHEYLKEIVNNRQIQIDMDDTDVPGDNASEEKRF